jgi:hypothetical protein
MIVLLQFCKANRGYMLVKRHKEGHKGNKKKRHRMNQRDEDLKPGYMIVVSYTRMRRAMRFLLEDVGEDRMEACLMTLPWSVSWRI